MWPTIESMRALAQGGPALWPLLLTVGVGSWSGRSARATGRPRLPCRSRIRALTLSLRAVIRGAVLICQWLPFALEHPPAHTLAFAACGPIEAVGNRGANAPWHTGPAIQGFFGPHSSMSSQSTFP